MHNVIVKFNADGTFDDRKRSGRPRKITPREIRLMIQIVMRSPKELLQENSSYFTLERSDNTFQHCWVII